MLGRVAHAKSSNPATFQKNLKPPQWDVLPVSHISGFCLGSPMHSTSSFVNEMQTLHISGHNSLKYRDSWGAQCTPQIVGSMRCPPVSYMSGHNSIYYRHSWDVLCIPQAMRCPPSISYTWS